MLDNIEEMVAVMEKAFAKKNLAEWVDILTAADLPFEIVQTLDEVKSDPQAWENDYIFKKQQADGRSVYYVRTPIIFTENPNVKEESGRGRAPTLGEDSSEILKGVGYDDATIASYLADGIVAGK